MESVRSFVGVLCIGEFLDHDCADRKGQTWESRGFDEGNKKSSENNIRQCRNQREKECQDPQIDQASQIRKLKSLQWKTDLDVVV